MQNRASQTVQCYAERLRRKEHDLIHLLLAVVCSTAIALLLKFGENRTYSRFAVLTANYLTASSISLMLITGRGAPGVSPSGTPALIGVPAGVLYFLGFYFYQRAARESGVSLAGSYAKLGILVPMILSIILWKELPDGLQWAGMGLALVAMGLVNIDTSQRRSGSGLKPALLLLFLCGGSAEFTNKLFQQYGDMQAKEVFLLFVFSTALLVSVWKLLRAGRKPRTTEIMLGLVIGVPNYFASYFLIHALSLLPASLVFPVYSAGSIALICLGGAILFREQLGGREWAAVTITAAALTMITI